MCLTIGGDQVHYPGDCVTPTVNILTVKLLLNSVVSTPGAKFVTIYIKDFHLNICMSCYKYMRLKRRDLPGNFVNKYNLLAQQLLEKRLNTQGYRQSELTPSFW